jgi:hypothetical protein
VSARDGVYTTPIRVSISVTGPLPAPIPVTPEAQSLETAPGAAAVAPAIVAPVARRSTAATVRGPLSVRHGMLSIALRCTDRTTACTGRLGLSAMLKGARRSLGTHAATIAPGASARVAVAIPGATRKLLRARAGGILRLRVAFTTASADGGTRTVTETVSLQLPR